MSLCLSEYYNTASFLGHIFYIKKQFDDMYSYEMGKTYTNTLKKCVVKYSMNDVEDFNHAYKFLQFNLHKSKRYCLYRKCNYTIENNECYITLLQIANNIMEMKQTISILNLFSPDKTPINIKIKHDDYYRKTINLGVTYLDKITYPTELTIEYTDLAGTINSIVTYIKGILIKQEYENGTITCSGDILNINIKETATLILPTQTAGTSCIERKLYKNKHGKYIVLNKAKRFIKKNARYRYVDVEKQHIKINIKYLV